MKKLLPLLLFLVPAVSFGQGSVVNDIAFKNLITGIAPAAGATVTVCSNTGTGIPCSPQVTVYSDIALTQPITPPILADSNGYYSFYASPGRYVVTVTGAGVSGRSITYILPSDTSGNNAFTGNNTHSGTETFTGGGTFSGVAPVSTSGASGTSASSPITVSGVTGGATSNAAGVAGQGSSVTVACGAGGAGTAGNGAGGSGGDCSIIAGAGGTSSGSGANPRGGNIYLTPGAGGTGGSGVAGFTGKVQNVVGGAADSFNNVDIIDNNKLYSVNPKTIPQATIFDQIDVSGDHTNGAGAFGADMVQFNQARIHDVTGTWPAFWEMQGMESEAEAFGTCAAPCGTTIPNFRLVSIGAQSHVRDSGTDNIVIPFVFDIWGLGPFRDSTSIASRPGTITVTNGSTAVTGSGTNFSAGADVGKLLWVAPNTQNGSMASSGCIITAVISATSMTCTSAWTWITQTSNYWTTTATSATGPGGSTSSMTNTLGGYFSQSSAGTSTNFALGLDGAPGHTEQSIGAVWKTNGVNQWVWETENNANTQSGDFVMRDFVASANAYAMRFRNPGNDGASQRGDAYINASGTNGRVNVNFLPGTGFAGEGAPTNVGTGGLCVGTGGAGATLTANPCALTGVIAIPFGTSIKSCNNAGVTPCAGDIPLVGTTGVNSEAVGDATAVNELFLSAATDDVVGSPKIIPLTAGATDLGSTARPFGNLWLGTAATNNFKFQPPATAAARVISWTDPLGAANWPFTNNTSTTTTQVMHATATAGLYTTAAIATADIATALTTPGPIGGTTPGTGKFTSMTATNLLWSTTAPTIAGAGCGGSVATISANNGTAAFSIFTGTAPLTACTVTMPAATTGWVCEANTVSATTTTNYIIKQTGAVSTTSVVLTLFTDAAVAQNYTASDTIRVKCTGY